VSSGASVAVVASPHTGSYSVRLGSTTPTLGDSSVAQTFVVPTGANTLSFWYLPRCLDSSITYAWSTATLVDDTTGTSSTILPKICSNTGVWANMTVPVTAGDTYSLTLTSHDDDYSADPTYTLYDDVTVSASAPPATGIVNGGFETGALSPWQSSGASVTVVTSAHSGGYSVQLGSTSPTSGDSSVAQTFTAPSNAAELSFWYFPRCLDSSITYAWATVTLVDNTTGVSTTVLPKVCTNTEVWTYVTTSIAPGDSYTLTLTSHDDDYSADPTYTLYDDVILQSATTDGVVNGGFETGAIAPWIASGASVEINTGHHSGSYSVRLGNTTPTLGDSSVTQTFTAPAGATTVSIWYLPACLDSSITYAYATVTLVDNTTGVTTTVLPKTCTNTEAWTNATGSVSGGHSYTITLTSHDDDYSADPTYTLFDDVVVQ
jgi:hypothetical protein